MTVGKPTVNLGSWGTHMLNVNHSKEFVNKETAACTNAIKSDWHHAKLHMLRYGTDLGDHAGYLAEFMWRCSKSDKDKFRMLVADINQTFKQKYLQKVPTIST